LAGKDEDTVGRALSIGVIAFVFTSGLAGAESQEGIEKTETIRKRRGRKDVFLINLQSEE
jgi:hypothetical protein